MTDYVVGQRWISDTEPDLGLGHIQHVEPRRVTISFEASGQTRLYATSSAPLTRVRFNVGDRIQSQHGWHMTVDRVEDGEGLLTYFGERDDGSAVALPEAELAHHIHFNQPKERLFAGQIDSDSWFRLRLEALRHQQELARLPVRGLIGGRVDLIPHQLYIADEVSQRRAPRVLLADEVGLGKTIEAGLILHRLLLGERIGRVLVIVPDALLYQWLVEMLRRFNVRFSILDEDRFEAWKEADPEVNPFLEEPHILCGLDFLTQHRGAAAKALAGEWDMLIVDEAHHLQWSPEAASPAYRLVEALAMMTPSLLLLTATPEQLGRAGHFARLRLLDAQRFHDFDAFLEEESGYPETAAVATVLGGNDERLSAQDVALLSARLTDDDIQPLLQRLETGTAEPEDRERLLDLLIDRHGTGRVLFRNTRAAVQGFPARRLMAHALTEDGADTRLAWLVQQLKTLVPERALLICQQAQTAIGLAAALRETVGLHAALFHERMSIVERDRAAAYFADEESGTPLLICSEIGSEGRNFQFAHRLILFDLPENPDLLEQRIGRLDRIGQQHTVHIHVPYLENSREAFWLRWYHEGLDAFEHTCPVGTAVLNTLEEEFGQSLSALAADPDRIDAIIDRTRELRTAQLVLLEQGRDRLLELNSCRPQRARVLCESVAAADDDPGVRHFMERTFDCYGVHFEDHSPGCWIAQPSDHMYITQFPGLPEEGCTLTTSREMALRREDIQFLSWDHPLARGALDLILHSREGNVTVAAIQLASVPAGQVLVESFFRLDCPADLRLNAQRYLPPDLLRVLVDPEGCDCAVDIDADTVSKSAVSVPLHLVRDLIESQYETVRRQVMAAEVLAEEQAPRLREQSVAHMQAELGAEFNRLVALAKVNPSIRSDELQALQDDMADLREALSQSRMQMEAVRVLFTH
ncbi:MAG: helicase SNF2 [Candidatus Entotheonella gemina]|uniref:Helicase SNF2 n=2 Tax=Candidatus Entotheonella TaxID=93171 RepID=W4ME22_9BACT|nr:MAG: helicase SNF2 [Candidatus Entotheonella gemina]